MAQSSLDVELKFYSNGDSFEPNGSYSLTVTIDNKNNRSLIGCYLLFEENGHFEPKKEFLDGSLRVNTFLRPYDRRNEETLPSAITCKLCDKDGKVITTTSFAMNLYEFISKKLFLANDETPRNTLLVGPAGSGKSSFINSTMSFLSHEIIREHAKSGAVPNGRVTKALKVYPIFDKNYKSLNIRLWDVWGFEKDAFVGNELQLILKGEVPHDWDMEAAKKGDLGPINRRAVDIPKRVQNAVAFFVPASDLDTEDSQTIIRTKAMMTIVSELELSCILVLSKFDSFVPNIEKDGRNCAAAQERINKASGIFGIEPSRVFPLVNYTKETANTFNTDRLIYRILVTLSEISEQHFLKQNYGLTAQQQRKRQLMFPFE